MSFKWIAFTFAIGLALALVGSIALDLLSAPRPLPAAPAAASRATPAPPTAVATVAASARSVPTRSAPAPATTAAPGVSSAEAQQVVRAFFAALDASDFDGARRLTDGPAREATDQIVSRVQSEAKARGVDLIIQTKRLDLAAPVAAGKQTSVDADFSTEVNGKIGPVVVPGQTIAGRATFTVDRVDGQVRIVQMAGIGL